MASPRDKEAFDIVQDLLDRTDEAFFAADMPVLASTLHLPYHFGVESSVIRIETYEELVAAFDWYRTYVTDLGATNCKRTCLKAKFRTQDVINATFDLTFFDDDGKVVLAAEPSETVAMYLGLEWRFCTSDSKTKIDTDFEKPVRDEMNKARKR